MEFFNYEFLIFVKTLIPAPILVYSLYSIFVLVIFLIKFKVLKGIDKKITRKRILNLGVKTKFRVFLIIFTIFFAIEFTSIFLEFLNPNLNLSQDFFFFLYLDKIFLNLGVIGILGILISYYCWKKDKFLFINLIFS